MAQQHKVGAHKTLIYTDDEGYVCVKYHSTDVVKYNNDYIILNTGGYNTNTTKTRMNQASYQFNLGYRVYQKDWEWYVEYREHLFHMVDNRITLMTDDDGKGLQLVGDIPKDEAYGKQIRYGVPDTKSEHARMDGVNQEFNDWRLGHDEEC